MVAVKTDCQLRHMSKQRLPIPAVDVERLLEEKKALEMALKDCVLQISYMHEKFGETGSGNSVLFRARAALDGRKDSKP